MITIADYIALRIKQIGINTVFGKPGQYNYEQITAFGKTDLKFCYSSNSKESLLSACGYSRISRLPGVVLTSHGSSYTNGLSGVFHAKMENLALLVLGSAPPMKRHVYTERRTMIKTFWMFKGLTSETIRVPKSKLAAYVIDQAIMKCWTYQKPVFLEVPQDCYSFKIEKPSEKIKKEEMVSLKSELDDAVNEILKMLKKSKNPIVWVGEDIIRQKNERLLEEFLKKSDMNFSTSLSTKSALNEKDENFVGVFMGRSSEKKTYNAFKKADLILCFGIKNPSIETYSVYLDEFNCQYYVHVSNVMVKIGCKSFGPVLMKDILTQLNKKIGKIKREETFYFDEEKDFDESKFTHDSAIKTIVKSGILKENLLLGDSSLSTLSLTSIPVYEKNTFLCQAAWQNQGYSLQASLGTYFGSKRRPIVFISDDGLNNCFYSLSTHVREKTKVIIFVFHNGIDGLTQWQQNPNGFKKNGKIDSYNILPKIDWKLCCESRGAKMFTVDNHDQLAKMIRKAKSFDGVSVIMMKIPQKDIPENSKWKLEKK